MSKTEIVKKYMSENKIKEALHIAKDFRIGVTKGQRSTMARAYECIIYPDFYKSIGKNIQECIDAGVKVLSQVI